MNKDRIVGTAKEAKGTAKKPFGTAGTASDKSAGKTDGLWARIQNALLGLKGAITGR